jgi:hypothetical protein
VRLVILSVGCLICAFAAVAHATARRVALINGDFELTRSVSIALSPWGVDVVPVSVDSPGSSLPKAAHRAAELARQFDVDAVIWVSASGTESVLWVYDARADDVSTRDFAEAPPFASPVAAAVALSLKTVLRTTVIAPESERFGATEREASSRPGRLRLESEGNVRFFASGMREFRPALGAAYWVNAKSGEIGPAMDFSFGSGVAVATDRFSGRFHDFAVSPSLRWWLPMSEPTRVQMLVGATGHFTTLEGVALSTATSVTSHRFNGSLDAGVIVALRLSSAIELGLDAKGSYLLHYQRYLVNGQPTFELWPWTAELGGHVSVALF